MDRKTKIVSGQRTTSFSWLLNDKQGKIGRMLTKVSPQRRVPSFMAGQFGMLYFPARSDGCAELCPSSVLGAC